MPQKILTASTNAIRPSCQIAEQTGRQLIVDLNWFFAHKFNSDELHLLLIHIFLLAGKNLELFLTYQTLRLIENPYRVEFIVLTNGNMFRCYQRY